MRESTRWEETERARRPASRLSRFGNRALVFDHFAPCQESRINIMSGTALPPPDSVAILNLEQAAQARSAYEAVLAAETAAPDDRHRAYARVVGYFLIHFPFLTGLARSSFVSEIHSCNTDGERTIYELGKWYLDNLILVCKSRFRSSSISSLFS